MRREISRLEEELLLRWDLRMITAIVAITEEELQDMVGRLVDIGSKYGIEFNIEKSQVIWVSRRHKSLLIKLYNREDKIIDNFK